MKATITKISGTITAVGGVVTAISKEKKLLELLNHFTNEITAIILFWILTIGFLFIIIYLVVRLFTFNSKDLKNHSYFISMRSYIDFDLNTIKNKVNYKRLVFTDLLQLKFEFWIVHGTIYITDLLKGCVTKQNFLIYTQTWLANGLIKQNKILKKNNIPTPVIKIFNIWHESRVNFLLNVIKKLDNNKSSIYSKVNTLFIVLDTEFDATMLDAETAVNTLNGDITGIEYNRIHDGEIKKLIL